MNSLIDWLLAGDVSIQYMTHKYLLNKPSQELIALRNRIATEGWGKAFLDARKATGHWGRDFYQVKWVSSHYTLLDLRNLEIEPVEPILETLWLILRKCKSSDGSINESHSPKSGDLCINGMFLNYASFFGIPETELKSIVDYLLDNIMPDGGFNCERKSIGAVHSSMHTTISVLEGIREYMKAEDMDTGLMSWKGQDRMQRSSCLCIDCTNQINQVRSSTKDGRCCPTHLDGGMTYSGLWSILRMPAHHMTIEWMMPWISFFQKGEGMERGLYSQSIQDRFILIWSRSERLAGSIPFVHFGC